APGGTPLAPVTCRETVGKALGVEHLRLDHLGQRHLPDQHFLAAVGVEGARFGQFVLVGGRQRQAVAVGENTPRVVVHNASPGVTVGQFRSYGGPFPLRTVRKHSRYVPEAPRKAGTPHLTPHCASSSSTTSPTTTQTTSPRTRTRLSGPSRPAAGLRAGRAARPVPAVRRDPDRPCVVQ